MRVNKIITKFVCVFCFCLFFIVPFSAFASLWDNETSKLNAVPYQTVMQVLVGNHLKHSQNYHFWRISMYEDAWNKNPDSLLLYDAMAISYHLTGRTSDAIRLMLAKERKKAGEYSTYANLTTFYIADRELYKARFYAQKLLKKYSPLALRDKYQVYWIDYLIECAARKGATKKLRRKITLPVQGDFGVDDLINNKQIYEIPNFYTFLAQKFQTKQDRKKKKAILTEQQNDEAIFAMLQLLRFSHSENIILIEAIGDLLLGKTMLPLLEKGQVIYTKEQLENQKGAAPLAAFAYLRAAQLIANYSPKAKKAYTFLASSTLLNHQNQVKKVNKYTTEDILVFLAEKIKDRDSYLQPIFEQEQKWIEQGLRLDKAFETTYLPDLESLENYTDSTFFIKTDTIASQLLYLLNNEIPDYLVVDSLQKVAYLAAFLAEEEVRNNKNEIIIVSRIDTQTSITVAITALISLSLAIILFFRFRKE